MCKPECFETKSFCTHEQNCIGLRPFVKTVLCLRYTKKKIIKLRNSTCISVAFFYSLKDKGVKRGAIRYLERDGREEEGERS